MEIDESLRELAKTNYYQTLYATAKDLNIELFKKTDILSDMQIRFINYLGFYSILYTDIALGDVENIILTHSIYEDAWIFYKNKKHSKKQTPAASPKIENKSTENTGTSWIFKRAKKKV